MNVADLGAKIYVSRQSAWQFKCLLTCERRQPESVQYSVHTREAITNTLIITSSRKAATICHRPL